MGIDPGLAATGWGLIDAAPRARYLNSGIIRTSSTTEHVARLDAIYRQIVQITADSCPEVACVERVFANMNGKTSMALGEARGAAIAALISCDVQVIEISALQIKKSITGHGRADKKQMAQMIPLLLEDAPAVRADAADALACALAATPMVRLHSSRSSRLPPIRGGRRRVARR